MSDKIEVQEQKSDKKVSNEQLKDNKASNKQQKNYITANKQQNNTDVNNKQQKNKKADSNNQDNTAHKKQNNVKAVYKTQQNNDNSVYDEQQKKDNSVSDKQEDRSVKEDGKQPKKITKHKINTRSNKIYRTPPSPSSADMLFKEKSFILDCNATSSISRDYSRTNPKLGPVIPPYNSQRDKHVRNYFKFIGVQKTLMRGGQYDSEATSIEGQTSDNFHQRGPGFKYLSLRNKFGAGHSQETIDGHAQFMQAIGGVSGYNGKYGFRRNTPWLRQTPTQFGTTMLFPLH